jgi:hypothetical protein
VKTNGDNQTAFGSFNAPGTFAADDPFVFMVGNGTAEAARSNAFAVANSGAVVIGHTNIQPSAVS